MTEEAARSRPKRAALVVAGVSAAIAAALAVLVVANGAEPETPKQAPALVEQLTRAPINVRAVRSLGLLESQSGDADGALRVMKTAGKLSRRDSSTQLWLFNHYLATAEYAQAFENADALMRRSDEYKPTLSFVIASSAADPRAADAIAARVATNPPWRLDFLNAIGSQARLEDTGRVLRRLAQLGSPPNADEAGAYLQSLVYAGGYAEAYADWRHFLPAKQKVGVPYDGGFSGLPGARPFNWFLGGGAGSMVEMAPHPTRAGDRVLSVNYDGMSGQIVNMATQTIVLTPGDYVLSGESEFTGARAKERFQWVITCLGGGGVPLNTALAAADDDGPSGEGTARRVAARFTIPETGCAGQQLELRAIPGERRSQSDVWYDNLTIRRVPSGAAR